MTERDLSSTAQTWRYPLAARIAVLAAAGFMILFAGIIFGIPTFAAPPGKPPDAAEDAIVYGTGIIIAGFGAFMTTAFVSIARTRLTFGPDGLDANVPDHQIFLLWPRYRRFVLPFAQIASIERREEIFRYLWTDNMRDALSIVTSEGRRIGLISNTNAPAIQFPLDDVASALAAATGHDVVDMGTVRTTSSGLYGAESSDWSETPLSPVAAASARRGALIVSQVVFALLAMTFLLRACL